MPDLIEGLSADLLLADGAFNGGWPRSALDRQDINPVIPLKSNQLFSANFDKETYKWQHLIENFFGKLKENRGAAMAHTKQIKDSLPSLQLQQASFNSSGRQQNQVRQSFFKF